jgi:hypothetical protein
VDGIGRTEEEPDTDRPADRHQLDLPMREPTGKLSGPRLGRVVGNRGGRLLRGGRGHRPLSLCRFAASARTIFPSRGSVEE